MRPGRITRSPASTRRLPIARGAENASERKASSASAAAIWLTNATSVSRSVEILSATSDESMTTPTETDSHVLGLLLFTLLGADSVLVGGSVSSNAIRHAWTLGEAWISLLPDRYQPVEAVAGERLPLTCTS